MNISHNSVAQQDLSQRFSGKNTTQGNSGTSSFGNHIESVADELERKLEGVECEDERNEIINEVLGCVLLGHFDPSKVDDVLTPETRYQLTQEDKDYFANKYDLNNMNPAEMDEMLYEMEQMGAITQTERLSVNPYLNTDGTLKQFSMVKEFSAGEAPPPGSFMDYYYDKDPLNFWEERMRTLAQELVTGGDHVNKDEHREELAGTQVISALLGSIFGGTATNSTAQSRGMSQPADYSTAERLVAEMAMERLLHSHLWEEKGV